MDYLNLGKAPIAGDNPAGSDCRYEADFESLQAEIDKLSSPTASGKVDWDKIVEWSAKILSNLSKDLTVAGYLAVGLVRGRQVEGLDAGIQVLRDLVENYWDTLYPVKKRMRGRAGALSWWLEKTTEVIEGLNPQPMPAEQVQRLQDNLQALDEFLGQNMPEPPLLRPLQRQIERFPVQKEAPPPSQERTAAPAAETEQPTAPPAEQSAAKPPPQTAAPLPTPEAASPASAQDAQKSIDTAIQLMRQASHFLLQQDLKDPSAYRYRRMAAWSRIDALPPNKEGVTQIPPPAPQVVGTLSELRDAANWSALVETVEQQRVSQFIFWLDLHWMVAEALQQLGPDYQSALREVCRETACFLQRLPGIEKLAFSDEMPFAEAQALNWLATLPVGASHGGAAGENAATGSDRQSLNTSIQEALALARKKKAAEAVDLLFRKLVAAPSRCEQTRWRLGIAQVLMVAKKGPAALPHLEQVVADVDTFKLERWDPQLALEGLTLAWKGFSSDGSKAHQDQAQALLSRIARLSPVDALKLGF